MSGDGDNCTVGETLRGHRRRAGLSQATLVRRAGISVRALREIEQDRVRAPHAHSLAVLADALGLSDDERNRLLKAGGAAQPPARAWQLRVEILGPLTVAHGGLPVEVGRGKRRSLLALFGLQPGQVVSRDEIVDVLWGDQPPATCRDLVNTYVARLRAVLEPAPRRRNCRLRRAGSGYVLELEEEELDLLRFLEHEARGNEARASGRAAGALECYAAALGCWRAALLADLDFSVRQHPAAAALSQRRVAVALAHADLCIEQGSPEAAVPHLRSLAVDQPLHEGLHARLMLALAGCGQQGAALTLFTDMRTRLREELGVEPGAELRAAQARVLRGDPSPTAGQHRPGSAPSPQPRSRPAQLPADVAGFTGRTELLHRLDSLLEPERGGPPTAVVISAIAGTAGVGKTALALHWAHRVRGRFPDGSLYANLRGFDPRGAPAQPTDVLDGFLRALGVNAEAIPPNLDDRSALFRTTLSDRRILLVLDNAANSEQLRPLLPGAPECLVVTTSRSRLTGLVAANSASRITVDPLPPTDAAALLATVIGAERTKAEPQATAQLTRQCAYLPLALRLVAERATTRPTLSLAALVRELAAGDDPLEMLAADDDPTTAVRAAFSWSYRALTPATARMFRLLGLHPGPDISLPIAAAIADVDQDDARRQLSALTSVHLLEETRRGRYRFHDLLSAYARECALADETQTARRKAEQRALDSYLRTADAADRMLMPRRRHIPLDPAPPTRQRVELATASAAIAWCDSERINLVAATRHAARTGDHSTAWKLPVALWSYFAIRKRWTDWITTHQVAIRAARTSGDEYGQAVACASLAHAYRDLRRFDEAIVYFDQALTICRKIGEQWVEAAALNLLAIAKRDLGRFDDALACSEDALRLFEKIGDPWGTGWTLYNLGEIYTDMRHFETAIRCSRKALATFEQIDEQWGASWTLVVLAQASRSMGRPHEAIDYANQALHVARLIGNQQGESLALYTLGKALFDSGRAHAARQAWQQALATFEELGAPQAGSVRQRLHDLDVSA